MSAIAEMAIKVCRKCSSEFSGVRCKFCQKAYLASWAAKNPEKIAAANAKYYAVNAGKVSARSKVWAAANPEKTRESAAKWRAANPEKKKASDSAWRNANPERVAATTSVWNIANIVKRATANAAWRLANPEACRIIDQNKRARKKNNGGKLSNGIAEKLLKLQKGKCACCGKKLGTNYHMDHIVPLAKGGSNTDDNIQLLTPLCNLQKHAKDPIDFMQSRGFLI